MHQVLDRVGEMMKGALRDVDHQPLKSDPHSPRWKNTAQWARNTMVADKLLLSKSPRGVWELSEAGRRYLQSRPECDGAFGH